MQLTNHLWKPAGVLVPDEPAGVLLPDDSHAIFRNQCAAGP